MVRFGILGAGMISGVHADAIISIDGAELVGVTDQNTQNADKFSEKYKIKKYESYEEMLNSNEIDAVCICTPSGFHTEQALEALSHEKHVVVEKPMALNTADADRIIAACEKSNCILTVVSQLRFSKDIVRVKKLVEENAFGTLVFCDLYMKYYRSEEYYKSGGWRGTYRFDGGGALMNQGIHGIDILQYIVGEPKVLRGRTKTLVHNIEVEDTAVALLEFENGALGVIEGSTSPNPGFERRIEILGSKGCAILKENKLEKLVINGEKIVENGADSVAGTANDPAAVQHEAHAKQIENFINAIVGEENLLIDCYEGQKAVKLIEEIYKFD